MKSIKIFLYLLIIITFVLIGFLYSQFTAKIILEEIANITRVIDGDTLETDMGKVRLLGVNSPEKNMEGYEEAKNFLLKFEGKQIVLERTKENKDKYGRLLRYAFYSSKLINEEILGKGLAHLYVYEEDKYTEKLRKAEGKARKKEIGIWEKSQDECSKCLILVELNYVDPGEFVILGNTCGFSCSLEGWTIKDDATHIKKLDFSMQAGQERKIDYEGRVWNDNGDSLYLRDDSGMLVLFYRY